MHANHGMNLRPLFALIFWGALFAIVVAISSTGCASTPECPTWFSPGDYVQSMRFAPDGDGCNIGDFSGPVYIPERKDDPTCLYMVELPLELDGCHIRIRTVCHEANYTNTFYADLTATSTAPGARLGYRGPASYLVETGENRCLSYGTMSFRPYTWHYPTSSSNGG